MDEKDTDNPITIGDFWGDFSLPEKQDFASWLDTDIGCLPFIKLGKLYWCPEIIYGSPLCSKMAAMLRGGYRKPDEPLS